MSPDPGNPSSFQDVPDEWCCCCCPLDPVPETVTAEFCGSAMDGVSITLNLVNPDIQLWKAQFPKNDECWSERWVSFECYECSEYLIAISGVINDGSELARCCDPLDVLYEVTNQCDGHPMKIHVTA